MSALQLKTHPVTPVTTVTTVTSIDLGNHTSFAVTKGKMRSIRSIFAQLNGQKTPEFSSNSSEIEFDGKRFLVGDDAKLCRGSQNVCDTDKTRPEIMKMLVFALLGETVTKLVISHYDEDTKPRLEALKGRHMFKANGVEKVLVITDVEFTPEGKGSYEYAKAQALIPQRGYTLVIDLGCYTAIASFYSPDGRNVATQPHRNKGVKALAEMVATDERLTRAVKRQLDEDPDIATILDGFASAHVYDETGITWAQWFDEYRSPWFSGIIAEILSKNPQLKKKITRVILTGGGANLVTDLCASKPLFQVLRNPERANVSGAYIAATRAA